MKGFGLVLAGLLASAFFAYAEPPEWSASPDASVEIRTTEGTMRYNLTEFSVTPGAKVKLTLANDDGLQHNLVLLKTEGDAASALQFAQSVWGEGEKALARGWMPGDFSSVLVASHLMDPKSSMDLYFVAPAKSGNYPFVCTVPGHAIMMNGLMKVRETKPAFKDLRYTLYEGEWTQLPDFASLKPVESGPVPDGRISLDVIGKRKPDHFALIFEGSFEVPEDEEYEFLLGSDDGSRLIIDGEGELTVDGIHPFKTAKKKLNLVKGLHSLTLQYFEASGGQELALAAKRKKRGMLTMSKEAPSSLLNPAPPTPVIPLRPLHEGEAVIYRNFIQGSSPRGIAVGYPGGVNLCWDADVCNVSMVWRGAFMDAGRHWTGRGVGSQPPMGFDVAAPAPGYPLQVLANPEESWKPFSLGTVRYEKDVPEPTKEITIKFPNSDYRFRGYRLDAKRYPEFAYDFRKLSVKDRFTPATTAGGIEAFDRVVTFSGEAEKALMFRVAEAAGAPDKDGWYPVGPVAIQVSGGSAEARPGTGGSEILVAISSPQEVTIHYRWAAAVGGKTPATK
jgi:azurin